MVATLPKPDLPSPALVIDGQAVAGRGRSLPLTSPLDGRSLGALTLADATQVEATVAAATTAAVGWGQTPIKDRVQVLFRFKSLVERHIASLSQIITTENGKTVAESEAGVRKGLEVVEFATSLPQVAAGQVLEVSNGVDCSSRRFPLGVVAGITPFNFPAMVPLWMLPLAIACGNAFILKPSEQVPHTAVRLAELLTDAGLPKGVFSVLQGDRATVEQLLDHQGVAAAAFVGSTPVAKAVYQRGTLAGKRVLALGGAKNHLVVLPDADPQVAAKNIASSAFGCAGQRCMAASVLIAVGDCEPTLQALVGVARSLRVGIDLGPVISQQARQRITGYIDRAEQDGAKLLSDGRGATLAAAPGGFYVGPTVIDGVDASHPCAREEIFGPVITVLRVKTLDEALAIENASPFGNAASLYTSSGAAAAYFEQRAHAGMIGINIGVPVPREPFAFGGWNESRFGVGDITGMDGVGFWTKTKKITRKWASPSSNWMS